MKKSVMFFICLFGIFLSATFSIGEDNKTDDKILMKLTKGDNGKKITLHRGEKFRIELKELGSAGYNWYFDNLNEEQLELVSKSTRAISEGKVGAPVMGIWLMAAKNKGTTEIKMDYYRIWEGKNKATEHFSVKLLIE